MVVFPNCKINLGLNILRKRDDGYHDLETCFYPVPLHDALEFIRTDAQHASPVFTSGGLAIDGAPDNNLCLKAWHLLKKDFPELPAVHIHLHKAIPMGAGLGGGSSDAAFMLSMLNSRFKLGIDIPQLEQYAAILGSDCAFFIRNRPCLATGRGEILTPANLDLSAYHLQLINPGIHVATGWAFSQLRPAMPRFRISDVISLPVSEWKDRLVNDFEAPVIQAWPEIGQIREKLYANGAVYAAMSGSGSTVFGLFENAVPFVEWEPAYFVRNLKLKVPPANH